ncbi:MAG: hypothetical protein Q4F43_08765 [Eubacteriales bacterium]|nr:hypothetical protein [Eubacteriales bacterium]
MAVCICLFPEMEICGTILAEKRQTGGTTFCRYKKEMHDSWHGLGWKPHQAGTAEQVSDAFPAASRWKDKESGKTCRKPGPFTGKEGLQ